MEMSIQAPQGGNEGNEPQKWLNPCWGAASERQDCRRTRELDPGPRRLVTPSPVLGKVGSLAFLVPRGCSKDMCGDGHVVLRTRMWYT